MPVRIAILGGPRCGKTTLIQQLYVEFKIRGLDVGAATEYSTEYLKEKGMIETISEQYGIYLGQLRLEESLNQFDYALTDYATFVPYIYGTASAVDNALKQFLDSENVKYTTIEGSTKDRARQILSIVGLDNKDALPTMRELKKKNSK